MGEVIRFDQAKNHEGILSFDEREDEFLVGRIQEKELFQQFLEGAPNVKRIWSLYGTGGVGKSTLLDMFRRQSRKCGAAFYLLDGLEFGRTGEAFCRKLLALMEEQHPIDPPNDVLEQVLNRVWKAAETRPVAIAVDTFEESSLQESWLRDEFLRRLHPKVLVIFSGRHPLRGAWLTSPAWRERTQWLPIDHLQREDVLQYALKCGISGHKQGEWLWERTRGHGLTLALAVSAELMGGTHPLQPSGWSPELASLWLKEVPDDELRGLVEAAAMLRLFNQELLEFVTEQRVSAYAFTRLTQFSFVRRTEKGWRLHDLMRDSTRDYVRERAPAAFRKLTERCVLYYSSVIRESASKRDVAFEVGELFYYIGNDRLRAFLNAGDPGGFGWEPLTEANLQEGLHYLKRRRSETVPATRRGIDPVTGELIEQTYSKQELLFAIEGLDLEELLALQQEAVMLMRTQDGSVCGLSAIIPINAHTIHYLERDPFSGPYIRSLTNTERKALEAEDRDPAGWFIKSIDVLDWSDTSMLLEAVSQMYRFMCAGKLFVATPPPLDMHYHSHLGLGFRIVPGVTHCSYDGKTATPTFVLDTRGKKLDLFLADMLKRIGVNVSETPIATSPTEEEADKDMQELPERRLEKYGLTDRERETVRLVIEGCSNAEIASRMYLSLVTVKKHLSAVYAKMNVKNRSQLIREVLGADVPKS